MAKSENMNTEKEGRPANTIEAISAKMKAVSIILFSPNFSTIKPAGIDITPYAIKNAKGKNPAMVSLKLKLDETLGFSAPKMFVKNEITKKVIKTNTTNP